MAFPIVLFAILSILFVNKVDGQLCDDPMLNNTCSSNQPVSKSGLGKSSVSYCKQTFDENNSTLKYTTCKYKCREGVCRALCRDYNKNNPGDTEKYCTFTKSSDNNNECVCDIHSKGTNKAPAQIKNGHSKERGPADKAQGPQGKTKNHQGKAQGHKSKAPNNSGKGQSQKGKAEGSGRKGSGFPTNRSNPGSKKSVKDDKSSKTTSEMPTTTPLSSSTTSKVSAPSSPSNHCTPTDDCDKNCILRNYSSGSCTDNKCNCSKDPSKN